MFPKGRVQIIAMIHLDALPGTPSASLELGAILDRATSEARLFRAAGVDALLVENMNDRPYIRRTPGPEITAAMTRLASCVREESALPTGVQILAGANREALAAAFVAGCEFIRAEGFVFAHVADEGYMDACASDLLRYRRQIGAERVAVLADIKKKHSSHAITGDVTLAETARAAEFFLADGLIVTGTATGCETSAAEVEEVRAVSTLPVLVGSGVTARNLSHYWTSCDGVIVGSHFKRDGLWQNPVDEARVGLFMEEVERLRGPSR